MHRYCTAHGINDDELWGPLHCTGRVDYVGVAIHKIYQWWYNTVSHLFKNGTETTFTETQGGALVQIIIPNNHFLWGCSE